MYKNNLPNVKIYYHHNKITKYMDNHLVPQSMKLSVYNFVDPKYLDL